MASTQKQPDPRPQPPKVDHPADKSIAGIWEYFRQLTRRFRKAVAEVNGKKDE